MISLLHPSLIEDFNQKTPITQYTTSEPTISLFAYFRQVSMHVCNFPNYFYREMIITIFAQIFVKSLRHASLDTGSKYTHVAQYNNF